MGCQETGDRQGEVPKAEKVTCIVTEEAKLRLVEGGRH